MAERNIALTVISVVVAVAAFLVSDIWARELQKKVDDLDRAMTAWTTTERYAEVMDVTLGRTIPSDLSGAKKWVQHRADLVSHADDAIDKLMGVVPMDENLITATLKMTRDYGNMLPLVEAIDSVDKATQLGNDEINLFSRMKGMGVLLNSNAWSITGKTTKKELRVRYGGYALSLLAIIAAGVAQIGGASRRLTYRMPHRRTL